MKKNIIEYGLIPLIVFTGFTACNTPADSPSPSPSVSSTPAAVEPTPQPAATATPAPAEEKTSLIKIENVKFVGKGADKVSSGALYSNNQPDDQFRIKISVSEETQIKSIEIVETDDKSNVMANGRQWTTASSSNPVIGVFETDGEKLNEDRSDKTIVAFVGTKELDLFVEAQDGTFEPGMNYKLVITDTTGAKRDFAFSI